MQCQICNQNEATIHLTEITEGSRKEIHLCESCAVEQGVAVKSQVPLNELLSNLLSSQPTDEEIFAFTDESKQACPQCGFTLSQFRKEALLGCPHDYEVFEKTLLPLIQKAHNGQTMHCGKVPSGTPEDSKKELEILSLRRQLETAIKAEDYEQAAKLRDRIAQLE